jgi:hypothetical protein
MKKRHHTIPKCYLEGFTDENGKVWVLDTKDEIFDTNPINIFVESHFYTITLKNGEKSLVIEDTLANIENAYADIYRNKISQDKFLTEKERAEVSVFFAAMMLRTRPYRENMRHMFEDLKQTMEEWREQYKTMSPEERKTMDAVPSSGGATINLEELEEGLKDFDEHHSADLIPQIMQTAQIIFDMKWAVWKYPADKGAFITSDDPLVIMRPASIKKYGKNALGSRPGLLFRDAEITLPLSKDRLLLAGWILNEDSYLEVPVEIAESMNQRTILHSRERMIASTEEQLLTIKDKYPPKQTIHDH